MMRLSDFWDNLMSYDGSWEYEQLPRKLSYGKYQSWNTPDHNLVFLGNFLRRARPRCILECGTFEARTTMYMAKILEVHSPPPRKIITIDLPNEIDHISEDGVRLYPRGWEWDLVMDIRHSRLNLLRLHEGVEIDYKEGLVSQFLPSILAENQLDFIYQDASHLENILRLEWKILSSFKQKEDLVVCFDDMQNPDGIHSHPFAEWFVENVQGWDIFFNDIDRGHVQMWIQRRKG